MLVFAQGTADVIPMILQLSDAEITSSGLPKLDRAVELTHSSLRCGKRQRIFVLSSTIPPTSAMTAISTSIATESIGLSSQDGVLIDCRRKGAAYVQARQSPYAAARLRWYRSLERGATLCASPVVTGCVTRSMTCTSPSSGSLLITYSPPTKESALAARNTRTAGLLVGWKTVV